LEGENKYKGTVKGKIIVITGAFEWKRKKVEGIIKEMGGTIHKKVGEHTELLLVGAEQDKMEPLAGKTKYKKQKNKG